MALRDEDHTPQGRWLLEQRRRAGMPKVTEVLRDLNARGYTAPTEATYRGWEARNAPGKDSMEMLEKFWGAVSPKAGPPVVSDSALAREVHEQVKALKAVAEAIQASARAQAKRDRVLVEIVGILANALAPEGTLDVASLLRRLQDPEPQPRLAP